MLEFQENFFEQEIRNGFYIDVMMKKVWAAELEVLQKVAEICDRHGIVWYAAWGTLLGAIRHEGFVPWDDDMDIWVKRKDYNRLLQILPEELPREYEIRSPLVKGGYDQFHTLINNGSFSIEEEHLRQYHGCPLSVGLDIYPLDYLPRGDEERELQKNLVMLTTRGAQVASWILDGEHEKAENPAEQKHAFIKEIWEGIHYLKESFVVEIEGQLV
ncbi:MAG: LicD family protein, partial [Acetatifactor sp.]|nr:LicD family protein [Acetatifactor sp.]